MKKTFINPVAQIVATGTTEMIATSNIQNGGDGKKGDWNQARKNTGAINPKIGTNVNTEALDF